MKRTETHLCIASLQAEPPLLKEWITQPRDAVLTHFEQNSHIQYEKYMREQQLQSNFAQRTNEAIWTKGDHSFTRRPTGQCSIACSASTLEKHYSSCRNPFLLSLKVSQFFEEAGAAGIVQKVKLRECSLLIYINLQCSDICAVCYWF